MSETSAEIHLLERAGGKELPEAAHVYRDINSTVLTTVSIPANGDYWTDCMSQAEHIIADADNNLLNAGTILRMVALEFAQNDTDAQDAIKKDCNGQLPTLGKDGKWSDGVPTHDDGGLPK
ncbi:MAG TPA: hypothetical protein VE172_20445 [Stackebrandtia sp.]|uniref:hypothetical protein n=1 Tax=Stackebrandtia sp. TaxID=2023065 RepID=UPI002D6ABB26|nr:hypothetical protein [Stackebrandtia sp.]HZE41176.1 hypothetical protein [Stackebrandtia sp.]